MRQINILHTKEHKDTYGFLVGNTNSNPMKHGAVDENKKRSTPPPLGNYCHRLCFLCTNASGKK